MYVAFQAICKLDIDQKIQVKLLTEIFQIEPNYWRVVGISVEALEVFQKHDYKKVSKMGINRSHIHQRADTYTQMIQEENNNKFKNYQDWYDYFWERDATYLKTSSENLQKSVEPEIIPIKNTKFKLFKPQGYSWRHGEEEVKCLKQLYKKLNSGTKSVKKIK